MNSVSNCIVCGKPLSGKQRSFCSLECKNDYYLNYKALKSRATKRKLTLIVERGGSCNRCGYSVSLDALSFYDKDGETLGIDTNVLANSNYEKLEEKLVGAQVLCRNCYEETQNPNSRDCRVAKAPHNNVKNKFAENLLHCGVKPRQTVVLGVSGGIDSVAMLDMFAKSGLNLNVIVAHMNHGLRKESDADEKFVAALTKKYNYVYRHSHILGNVRMSGGNMEELFRNERRNFLLDTERKSGANFVALAHNANDQAETFIMNAVRGSGPAGLGAMSMSEEDIIRPLLNFSRTEIVEYVRENELYWHEDESNKDLSYRRNYIRHRVLPMLEQLNPELLSAINRTTLLQRNVEEHLKEEAYRAKASADGSCEHLRRLDKPLLYEVLGLLYEEIKGDRQNLTLIHLAAIENLIRFSTGSKSLDLPSNVVVSRNYDKLDFCKNLAHNNPSTPSTKKLKLGEQRFGRWKISISPVIPAKAGIQEEELYSWPATRNDKIILDAAALSDLSVRTRKPGDKIVSLGMTNRKKLQDLFVDAKIGRDKRDGWPIIFDHNTDQVIWVPYLAKTALTPKTKKLLKIKITEATHETT